MPERPRGILIAGGYDPSGGAGVLADAKTAEALNLDAAAVLSALTVQSAERAEAVQWVDDAWLDAQLERLLSDIPFAVLGPGALKLGLLRDADQGHRILDRVLDLWPDVPVVWDPVLSASAGLDFRAEAGSAVSGEAFPGWSALAARCRVWTPNFPEWARLNAPAPGLLGRTDLLAAAAHWAGEHPQSLLWLKGGHDTEAPGLDRLFHGKAAWQLEPDPVFAGGVKPKHGSGCVLATATAVGLAKGLALSDACAGAKRYTEAFLASTPDLLGRHQPPELADLPFSTVRSN